MTKKARYSPGDYVKFEIRDDDTGVSEWMWLKVENADDEQEIVQGKLENQPVVFAGKLRLGQDLLVSYNKIRECRRWD